MWWMKQFHAYSETVTIKKNFIISFIASLSGTLKVKLAIQSHFIHLCFLFSDYPFIHPKPAIHSAPPCLILCPGSLNLCKYPSLAFCWIPPMGRLLEWMKALRKGGSGCLYLLFGPWLPSSMPTTPDGCEIQLWLGSRKHCTFSLSLLPRVVLLPAVVKSWLFLSSRCP